MVHSNNDLKKGGRGNGTLCRGISLKLKKDCFPTNKNWDGRKVQCISVEDVEYMTYEEDQKIFRIIPDDFRVNPLVSLWGGRNINRGGIKIIQVGVNSHIATTWHTLQGMTNIS